MCSDQQAGKPLWHGPHARLGILRSPRPERAEQRHRDDRRGGQNKTRKAAIRKHIEERAKKLLTGEEIFTRQRSKTKARPSLRTLVRALDDNIKKGLVEVLVMMAKVDPRWAELYSRYEGSLRQGGSTKDIPCCLSITDHMLLIERLSAENDRDDEDYEPEDFIDGSQLRSGVHADDNPYNRTDEEAEQQWEEEHGQWR